MHTTRVEWKFCTLVIHTRTIFSVATLQTILNELFTTSMYGRPVGWQQWRIGGWTSLAFYGQVALHRGATGVDERFGSKVAAQLVLANMFVRDGCGAAAIAVPHAHKSWLKADAP